MEEDTTIAFIYRDSRGQITARTVRDWSDTGEYIQGECSMRNGLRTFRTDRVLEFLGPDADPEVRLQFYRSTHPPPELRKPRRPAPGTLEVCFTGFKAVEKAALLATAEASGFHVRPAVTKHLHILCCGSNAGPAKVRKARLQGVLVLSEGEFRTMAETGEVPDE
jgi:NAD-dependent DNA ligase